MPRHRGHLSRSPSRALCWLRASPWWARCVCGRIAAALRSLCEDMADSSAEAKPVPPPRASRDVMAIETAAQASSLQPPPGPGQRGKTPKPKKNAAWKPPAAYRQWLAAAAASGGAPASAEPAPAPACAPLRLQMPLHEWLQRVHEAAPELRELAALSTVLATSLALTSAGPPPDVRSMEAGLRQRLRRLCDGCATARRLCCSRLRARADAAFCSQRSRGPDAGAPAALRARRVAPGPSLLANASHGLDGCLRPAARRRPHRGGRRCASRCRCCCCAAGFWACASISPKQPRGASAGRAGGAAPAAAATQRRVGRRARTARFRHGDCARS